MPSYEASILLRKLTNPEAAVVLKRSILKIFDNKGVFFGVENLGSRALPYKMRSHGTTNKEGRYFLVKFDAPTAAVKELLAEYDRDLDIIRSGFNRIKDNIVEECTLEEELKPPAYRKDVADMIATGRKEERKFEPNCGLDYYPWRV